LSHFCSPGVWILSTKSSTEVLSSSQQGRGMIWYMLLQDNSGYLERIEMSRSKKEVGRLIRRF
jgi:hypothetical protein